MNQLRLFRILMFVQIGLTLLSILASVRLQQTLPAPLQAYLRGEKESPLARSDAPVAASALILMAAMVVAWVALFRFWRVGPWIYLACCAGAVVLTLAGGPTVETAIESALSTAWAIIGGAILALAFASDLRVRFGIGPSRSEDL